MCRGGPPPAPRQFAPGGGSAGRREGAPWRGHARRDALDGVQAQRGERHVDGVVGRAAPRQHRLLLPREQVEAVARVGVVERHGPAPKPPPQRHPKHAPHAGATLALSAGGPARRERLRRTHRPRLGLCGRSDAECTEAAVLLLHAALRRAARLSDCVRAWGPAGWGRDDDDDARRASLRPAALPLRRARPGVRARLLLGVPCATPARASVPAALVSRGPAPAGAAGGSPRPRRQESASGGSAPAH